MSARAWVERDHPRHPAEDARGWGGRFRESGGGWMSLLSDQLSQLRSDGRLLPPEPAWPANIDPAALQEYREVVRAMYEQSDWPPEQRFAWERDNWDEKLRRDQIFFGSLSESDPNEPARSAVVRERIYQQEAQASALREYRDRVRPNMPLDDLQIELAAKAKRAFADKKVAVRVTPKRLERMLERGRLRTLHESGTSKGYADQSHRSRIEEAIWGIPLDAPWQDRPIYGYLTTGDEPAGKGGKLFDEGVNDALSQYGRIQLILKPEVRDRTTAMFGDSNDLRALGHPEPVNDPGWRAWTPVGRAAILTGVLKDWERDIHSPSFREFSYIEAQVHGGVEVNDIAEVVFPGPPPKPLREALQARGIPWRVLREGT